MVRNLSLSRAISALARVAFSYLFFSSSMSPSYFPKCARNLCPGVHRERIKNQESRNMFTDLIPWWCVKFVIIHSQHISWLATWFLLTSIAFCVYQYLLSGAKLVKRTWMQWTYLDINNQFVFLLCNPVVVHPMQVPFLSKFFEHFCAATAIPVTAERPSSLQFARLNNRCTAITTQMIYIYTEGEDLASPT